MNKGKINKNLVCGLGLVLIAINIFVAGLLSWIILSVGVFLIGISTLITYDNYLCDSAATLAYIRYGGDEEEIANTPDNIVSDDSIKPDVAAYGCDGKIYRQIGKEQFVRAK